MNVTVQPHHNTISMLEANGITVRGITMVCLPDQCYRPILFF